MVDFGIGTLVPHAARVFRLIDRHRRDRSSPPARIQVEANVPAQSTIFEGHFPGYPLMPGVLLLEAMAQASGWLIIGVTNFTGMPLFAAFKEAKLRSFVTPGTALHRQRDARARRLRLRRHARAEIRRRDEHHVLCNAEITFRLIPFPSPQFRDSIEKVAAAIAFPMELSADG